MNEKAIKLQQVFGSDSGLGEKEEESGKAGG